jgi:hypothetical protein
MFPLACKKGWRGRIVRREGRDKETAERDTLGSRTRFSSNEDSCPCTIPLSHRMHTWIGYKPSSTSACIPNADASPPTTHLSVPHLRPMEQERAQQLLLLPNHVTGRVVAVRSEHIQCVCGCWSRHWRWPSMAGAGHFILLVGSKLLT